MNDSIFNEVRNFISYSANIIIILSILLFIVTIYYNNTVIIYYCIIITIDWLWYTYKKIQANKIFYT